MTLFYLVCKRWAHKLLQTALSSQLAPKTKAVFSSETLVPSYPTARRYNLGDQNIIYHGCDNLTTHSYIAKPINICTCIYSIKIKGFMILVCIRRDTIPARSLHCSASTICGKATHYVIFPNFRYSFPLRTKN